MARHTGIDTTRVKVLVLCALGAVMALVGAVLALRYPYIDASIAFNNTWSFQVLIAALLGGPGRPGGRRSAPFRWCCCRSIWPAASRITSPSRSACASSSIVYFLPGGVAPLLERCTASIAAACGSAAPGCRWPAVTARPTGSRRPGAAQRALADVSAARPANGVALSVRGLHKAFGGLVAVRDISFDVPPGGITGLIGPNGSGKTTVLNLITGELPPDRGSILSRGRGHHRLAAVPRSAAPASPARSSSCACCRT